MSIKNAEVYITINNPNPDFQDFMLARAELNKLGIFDESKVGVILSKHQWYVLKGNVSRFESTMLSPVGMPKNICGFPVKIVEFFIEEK